MASSKGKTSKTAKASMPSSKGTGGYDISPDIARVIPLGQGEYAYVLTATGATRRTKVGSEEFHTLLRELAGTAAVRITLEVINRCAAQYATAGWSQAVLDIQGIEPAPLDEETDTTGHSTAETDSGEPVGAGASPAGDPATV